MQKTKNDTANALLKNVLGLYSAFKMKQFILLKLWKRTKKEKRDEINAVTICVFLRMLYYKTQKLKAQYYNTCAI